MATSIKAVRVEIVLGKTPLEVFQLPDGNYVLSQNQVLAAADTKTNDYPRFIASKGLKDLPCMTLNLPQFTVNGGKVKPLTVEQASLIWGALAEEGNRKAVALLMACAVEAIERRADAALGIQRSEQERNERLKLTQERLEARRAWTDIIMLHLMQQGRYNTKDPNTAALFKALTVLVNQALFGQAHFKCNRNNMTLKQQKLISSFETMLAERATRYPQESPERLVKTVLSVF